jgi:hypothetical protein
MMSVPIPNVPAPNITATTDNPKRYCIAKWKTPQTNI